MSRNPIKPSKSLRTSAASFLQLCFSAMDGGDEDQAAQCLADVVLGEVDAVEHPQVESRVPRLRLSGFVELGGEMEQDGIGAGVDVRQQLVDCLLVVVLELDAALGLLLPSGVSVQIVEQDYFAVSATYLEFAAEDRCEIVRATSQDPLVDVELCGATLDGEV